MGKKISLIYKSIWYSCMIMAMPTIIVGVVDTVQKERIPGTLARVQLVSVENNTVANEFDIFPPIRESVGLSLPMATLSLVDEKNKGVDIDRTYPLIIKCSKGSYQPVFILDGDKVSGQAPQGYSGPYCMSMWLPYPQVSEAAKLRIPYVVANGKQGKISIKIGSKGDYRLVAVSDIKFLNN